jgi:hypothetical protein
MGFDEGTYTQTLTLKVLFIKGGGGEIELPKEDIDLGLLLYRINGKLYLGELNPDTG